MKIKLDIHADDIFLLYILNKSPKTCHCTFLQGGSNVQYTGPAPKERFNHYNFVGVSDYYSEAKHKTVTQTSIERTISYSLALVYNSR
jgi:hypothetical protein